jgi:hypothetical protein
LTGQNPHPGARKCVKIPTLALSPPPLGEYIDRCINNYTVNNKLYKHDILYRVMKLVNMGIHVSHRPSDEDLLEEEAKIVVY